MLICSKNVQKATQEGMLHPKNFIESARFLLVWFREQSKATETFPMASDIYDIDTDHANIINDVKVNYAEQEILYKKMKNRSVSNFFLQLYIGGNYVQHPLFFYLQAELMEEVERLKKENQLLARVGIIVLPFRLDSISSCHTHREIWTQEY